MRKNLIYKKRVQDETGREYILWYSLVIRVAEHGRIYGVEIEKTNEYGRQERALIALSLQDDRVSLCLNPIQGKIDLYASPYLLRLRNGTDYKR